MVKWAERDLPLAFLKPIGYGKGYDRKELEGIKVRGGQLPTPTVLCSKKQAVRQKGLWVDRLLTFPGPFIPLLYMLFVFKTPQSFFNHTGVFSV